jgi:hypothetical protein
MAAKDEAYAESFHTYMDRSGIALGRALSIPPVRAGQPAPTRVDKHITTYTRSLAYDFTPHFHPYVTAMVKRLIERSVNGLQALDTEYVTIARLSAGTPARRLDRDEEVILDAGESVLLPDGAPVVIVAGTELTRDGAKVTLDDSAKARLAGAWVLDGDEAQLDLAPGVAVTFPPGVVAVRAGGIRVKLTGAALMTLPEGRPRLLLFEDFFQQRYAPSPSSISPIR